MNSYHRILRVTTFLTLNRAIRDIRRDWRRGTRNLADLGEYFAKTQKQKRFFSRARKIVEQADSAYSTLMRTLVTGVDEKTIKTVGTNIGCTSLTYGATVLRRQEKLLGHHIPWLLFFDWRDSGKIQSDIDGYLKILKEGVSLGIYCYLFCLDGMEENTQLVLELAESQQECTFFVCIPARAITDFWGARFSGAHNIVVLMDADHSTEGIQSCQNAAKLLEKNRAFFGFSVSCNDVNTHIITSDAWLNTMIGQNCTLGLYLDSLLCSDKNRESIYQTAYATRCEKGKPILILDADMDIQNICELVLPGSTYLKTDAKGRVSYPGDQFISLLEHGLAESIAAVMPSI